MKPKYLLILPFFMACTEREPHVETLAVVNGVTITKSKLVSRLELTPLLKSNVKMDLVEETLDIIIDEIVVSQWAKKRKLNLKEDYKRHISFTKRQALIRELFYKEIREQAISTQREIDTAFENSLHEIVIVILHTQDEDISDQWRNYIKAGKTFKEIEEEYEGNQYVQESLVSFHWGDSNIPPKIQMISYETKVGRLSDVFRFPSGYGILTVQNRVKDTFVGAYNHLEKKQEISKIIQARKEDLLASKYVEKLLKYIEVQQLRRGFNELGGYLGNRTYLKADQGVPEKYRKDIEMKSRDKYNLSTIVIKSPDFEWDGNDILNLLKQYNFQITSESIGSISKTLTAFLKGAVKDYYLEKRAMDLGMESNVRVRDDLEMWSRYYLYLIGVNEMIIDDSTNDNQEIVRGKIQKLRSEASIVIYPEMVKGIRITGIPMLVLWNREFSKNLAVPPLIRF